MRPAGSLLLCTAACHGAFIKRGNWQKPKSAPVDYDEASPYQSYRNESYDWDAAKQRVLDHAMRDVARYAIDESHKATKLALRSALLDKTHAIWILQGRLFVHKAYLGEMKRELHLRFMNSVLRKKSELIKNTVYTFDEGASGPSHDCDPHLPKLVIAKKNGEKQCGILVPNPYFGDLYRNWERERSALVALGRRRKWENRRPQLFWRGKIRGREAVINKERDCSREAGNYARLQAASLTAHDAKKFDVRTNTCRPRPIRSLSQDLCRKLLPQNDDLAAIRDSGCKAVQGRFMNHGKFNTFQFLLDLPGSTTGSYSRNLNHLWLLGAVVVFWSGPLLEPGGALQWYSAGLRDGRTHVTVNVSTAKATLNAIYDHVAWRNELLENSRGVADNLLCGECMGSYMTTVLTSLRQRLPLLDSALNQRTTHSANATLAELLQRENCARHFAAGLVEVVRGTPRNRREPGWSVTWRTAATGAAACDLLGALAAPFRDPKMNAMGRRGGAHIRERVPLSSA